MLYRLRVFSIAFAAGIGLCSAALAVAAVGAWLATLLGPVVGLGLIIVVVVGVGAALIAADRGACE